MCSSITTVHFLSICKQCGTEVKFVSVKVKQKGPFLAHSLAGIKPLQCNAAQYLRKSEIGLKHKVGAQATQRTPSDPPVKRHPGPSAPRADGPHRGVRGNATAQKNRCCSTGCGSDRATLGATHGLNRSHVQTHSTRGILYPCAVQGRGRNLTAE